MGTQGINTARFNELLAIDSLNPEQLAAVRKLRRKAGSMGVSVYTLGVLCARSPAIDRLSDARRLRQLSPASREVLIEEVRDVTRPYATPVVAVWSAWCEQNGVDPEQRAFVHVDTASTIDESGGSDPDHPLQRALAVPAEVVADAIVEHSKRKYEVGARKRAMQLLRKLLEDGPRSRQDVMRASEQMGFNYGTVQNAARDLGVVALPGDGNHLIWALPTVGPEDARSYARGWHRGDNSPGRRLIALIDEIGLHERSADTLARWAEMKLEGRYPRGTKVGLPARESDEGIELAERVFQACLPVSPEAAASQVRILRRLS